MKLNAEQEAAALLRKGPALILAGPGSGKTAVITCRTLNLITQFQIPAEQILVVTFSRKAAESMKERFLRMQKGVPSPFFGTFHSLFFYILKQAYGLSAKNIITESQKLEFLLEEADKLALLEKESEEDLEVLLGEIGCVKSRAAQLESFRSSVVSPEEFRQLFAGYARSLNRAGLIDFDDMQSLCLELLSARPDILRYWQSRFRYILIDEFQDINQVQYEILRLLALPENNLFVVGDDDQSIYAFRGAKPAIMAAFLKDYPAAGRITLNKNYRCFPRIQQASHQMIRENRRRFPKNLKSALSASPPGHFKIRLFPDQRSEYAYLADQIQNLLSKGVRPEEIAVLVRSSLDLSFLEEILKSRNLPLLSAAPSKDPFRSFIWEDLSAYLRIAEGMSGKALSKEQLRKDFFRILNRPSRFLPGNGLEQAFLSGAKTSPEVLSFLSSRYRNSPKKLREVQKLREDLNILKKCSAYAALKYLKSAMHYEEVLYAQAARYRKRPEEYLAELSLLEEALEKGIAPGSFKAPSKLPETPSIHLMTIHAAKGLEFPFVFLPDLNEGVLPIRQAKKPSQIEEERRIFYVGMTRASEFLEICCCETIRSKKAAPSRFLSCFFHSETT